jgi:hypothetical protein
MKLLFIGEGRHDIGDSSPNPFSILDPPRALFPLWLAASARPSSRNRWRWRGQSFVASTPRPKSTATQQRLPQRYCLLHESSTVREPWSWPTAMGMANGSQKWRQGSSAPGSFSPTIPQFGDWVSSQLRHGLWVCRTGSPRNLRWISRRYARSIRRESMSNLCWSEAESRITPAQAASGTARSAQTPDRLDRVSASHCRKNGSSRAGASLSGGLRPICGAFSRGVRQRSMILGR